MSQLVAKIAVSGVPYAVDRPYRYAVPLTLSESARPGCRVRVPFGRGNREKEGIILALEQSPEDDTLKEVSSVLDPMPVLTPQQIQLALFMRERYFCTIYDAVKSMLPTGLWLDDSGRQRIQDKYVDIAKLQISHEEALQLYSQKVKTSPKQAALLKELAFFGEIEVKELLTYTGASRASLNALIKSGVVTLFSDERFRRPDLYCDKKTGLPLLNREQKDAYLEASRLRTQDQPGVMLLQGVTGSGKTSVYLHLISDVLAEKKSAILLVPEIALTPQMLKTFSSHFGDEVAVLHSRLTGAERYDEWKRIKRGDAHLVIGTRSAVFAPVEHLGLIIIDEEQEESYKSENSPRYQAADIAQFRTYHEGALLLLGSATPKVSTRFSAMNGTYHYAELLHRYNDLDLPEVAIVDMKEELRHGNAMVISHYLRDEIQKNLDHHEQTILFLNRRGAHKLVTCGQCGFVYKCPNCSVYLTYHSYNDTLLCHYCGYRQKLDSACPECGGKFRFVGAGTQLVEQQLKELFGEDLQTIRLDADVISSGLTHEEVLEKFRTEKIPILIGTQMVTKGLNFENVTLVGVISADQSLYASDYRAAERTFSQLTQVVGRAGRGSKIGRAVIQTYSPENETILQAARQDYEGFYQSEIALRELLRTPPFYNMIPVIVSGENETAVQQAAKYAKARLSFLLQDKAEFDLLGPAPMSVVRVNNVFRYRLTLRCQINAAVRKAIATVLAECSSDKRFRGITFFADSELNQQ